MAVTPCVTAVAGIEVSDWREAIRTACSPLVRDGAVEDKYAESCVSIVESHGPYIVLAPGIAFAHARPEDGVLKLCLSVATLSEPVPFGHPENDPVDVVFAFGSPDDGLHVGLLAALAEHLSGDLAERLRASDAMEASELLRGVIDDIS